MALSSRDSYPLYGVPDEIQRAVDHACHIDKVTFKVGFQSTIRSLYE